MPLFRKILLFFILGAAGRTGAQPLPCGPEPDMTSFCAEACVICDIDGYTGINSDPEQGQAPDGFCTTTVHHMQWIAFIAGSTDLTITVAASNCNSGFGLEVGIYESLDCENFNLVSNCDGDIQEGQTGVFTNTVPLTIGQYYYFVMDGNHGDVCNYTIHVTQGSTMVPPLPPAGPVDGPAEICVNDTAIWSIPAITGANFYRWTIDGVFAGEGNSAGISFNATGVHELCVMAYNVCDTVPPSCMTVEVFGPQTTFLTPQICSGDGFEVADTTLFEAGDYSFLLNSVHGCDSIVFVSLSLLETVESFVSAAICSTDSLYVGDTWYSPPGTFQEVQLSYNGCDSIINLSLSAIICEITGSVAAQPVLCFGGASGALTFAISDGTPPFTYVWEKLGGSLTGSGNLANTGAPETIPGLSAGVYLITVQDLFGNDVVLIGQVEEPPVLSLAMEVSHVSCHGGQDGAMYALPQGGTPPYSYTWSTGATLPALDGLPAGNYSLTVADANGCLAVMAIDLEEPPLLVFSASFTNPGCDGNDTGLIAVEGVNGGTPPYQYSLSGAPFADALAFGGLTAGYYTLAVRDANGCQEDTTAMLVAALIPNVDAGEDLSISLGEAHILHPFVDLVPQVIGWSPGIWLSCYTCLEPMAGPYETTVYTLTVTSADGCVRSDSLTVFVEKVRDVFVPNIFTPNQDGINDAATVFAGKSVRQIKSFRVFSRWGELVFEQYNFPPNSPSLGWDGRFNGLGLPEGVFVWVAEVEYLDGVVSLEKGDVTLVR
jgi:gliding motility-associated-like protein